MSQFAAYSCATRRSFRNESSKDMAFPHPQSRKDHYRKEDKPSCGSVVWKFFKRTINITEYRNGEDDVNPAKNRTFGGIFHDRCDPLVSRLLSRLRRPVGRFNPELLCVLRVQTLPAAELQGLGADDASGCEASRRFAWRAVSCSSTSGCVRHLSSSGSSDFSPSIPTA